MVNKRILVVDDDARLRDLLVRYLGEQGYTVQAAADSVAMDKLLAREHFDLMVLDLMLPNEDGLAICRRLRGTGENLPIIMLTAKGDEVDRIVGLEMGADDYLAKPFNPRELLARINAVLRRRNPEVTPSIGGRDEGVIEFGQFKFDVGMRRLSKNEVPITLTSGEFSLLHVLARNPRQPLSRDKLMELARGRELEVYDRSIDVQISRLRKLIETDPATPQHIQTVWGFGYVFMPDGGVA
ncbi:MAG: two-component system response regulator OmpR [Methylophilaceae bacterium]